MPTTIDVAGLRVVSIGSGVARALARGGAGNVCAVFERSIHISVEGGIVCIGGAGIGNGPLNAIVEPAVASHWPGRIVPGERVEIVAGAVELQRWRFVFAGARTWRPEPWPQVADAVTVRSTLDRVRSIVGERAPHDGLVRLAVCGGVAIGGAQSDALARIAAPRLAALGAGKIETDADSAAAITALLGLGPGLTPSGDDVLCGALIGLHAVGAEAFAAEMAGAVLPAAPYATTPLSCAFLEAAAAGEGGEALHGFIGAVVAGRGDRLDAAMEALGRIGHTSGWDALAGAYLALKAWAAAQGPTRSP
jgi:hypothetical protein